MSDFERSFEQLARDQKDWVLLAQLPTMSPKERLHLVTYALAGATKNHDDENALRFLDLLAAAVIEARKAAEEPYPEDEAYTYELVAAEFLAQLEHAPFSKPGSRVVPVGRHASRTESVLKPTLEKMRTRAAHVVSKAWLKSKDRDIRYNFLRFLCKAGPNKMDHSSGDVAKLNADVFASIIANEHKLLRKDVGEAYLYLESLIPDGLAEALASPYDPGDLMGVLARTWHARVTGKELSRNIRRALLEGIDERTALERLTEPVKADEERPS